MPTLTWPTKALPDPQPASLTLDSLLYPNGTGYPAASPENALYLGDNLEVMAALLPEYEGRLDLIYADPPFFTNRRYPARLGLLEDSRRPQEWQLTEGYGDNWDTLDSYLDFLYPRLALMYRLLSPRGTLYLHLDWHADAYARLLLDEIFGRSNLINEIIWTYHGPSPIRRAFNRKHDTILAYAKSPDYIFNADAVREAYHPTTIKTFASSPKAGFGKVPDLGRGKVPEDWWYFPVVARLHNERTGYPTQKPEALLERILLASSEAGSLVADFFCGSGTFPVVAARHRRRFLACDSTWRAIHITRKRLTEVDSSPFRLFLSANVTLPVAASPLTGTYDPSTQTVRLTANGLGLDYWEADPAWDGKIFRSALQVRRPNRSDKIDLERKLPVAASNLRIRAVTIEGDLLEATVQASSR